MDLVNHKTLHFYKSQYKNLICTIDVDYELDKFEQVILT